MKDNSKIFVIGNLYDDPVPKITLEKFLNILNELFTDIGVISGDLPIFKRFDRKNKSDFTILVESLKRQIKVINLIKNENFNKAIVLLPFLILPIIYIKIVKKKPLILYVGGRASKSIIGEVKSGNYFKIPLYILVRLVESISFKLADTILVDSYSSVIFLGMKNYIKKVKIYNPYVNLNKFKIKKEIKDREKIIGYIGRISKEKGILEFVKAIELLGISNKSLKFFIGGDGVLLPIIKNTISLNDKLNYRTKFYKWIDQSEMPEVLNKLSLLVLPSYSEGTPNILIEAMACGTPVLATLVGGVPELIVNGHDGFIIEKNDPETISMVITDIIESYNLEEISINGRIKIENEFNYEKTLENYRKIFSEE